MKADYRVQGPVTSNNRIDISSRRRDVLITSEAGRYLLGRSSTADIDATTNKLDGGQRGSEVLSRVRSVGSRAPMVPPDGRNDDRDCERHNHPWPGEPPAPICAEHRLTACAHPPFGDDVAVLDDMGQPSDIVIPCANGTIRRFHECATHVSRGSKVNTMVKATNSDD